MLVAKQVADFLTFTRALLLLVFVWLGIIKGAESLPFAALLMIYSWTSDSLDGPLARRSSRSYHTWLGDHDLEVDMAVSVGLLLYMMISGFVPLLAGLLYLLLWIAILLYFGFYRSLGMTFQAPIYGWFLWIALRDAPEYGLAMVAWILAVLAVTWPKFPKEVVPGFLSGFKRISKR